MKRLLDSTFGRVFMLIASIIVGLLVNSFGRFWMSWYFYEPIVDGIFPLLGYLIIIIGMLLVASKWIANLLPRLTTVKITSPLEAELAQALERVQAEPEKAKPAWDLARVRLELYFDRNLSQINYIFWLSVLVMLVGFGFILFGISQTFTTASNQSNPEFQPSSITPAVVGAVAGVITEFIGATFLFIYRSTIQQASTYIRTLERINSVGMAMQILDTISSDSKDLQDSTKAEIVKTLLSQSQEESRQTSLVEQAAPN